MLDLQPLHLITICVGFIIAYGLFQAVESLRRRRQRREADAASRDTKPTEQPPTPPDLEK